MKIRYESTGIEFEITEKKFMGNGWYVKLENKMRMVWIPVSILKHSMSRGFVSWV